MLAYVVLATAALGATAPLGVAAPAIPAPASPGDGARVEAVPPFSWRTARGAAKYEFQLSADPAFRSIVEGGSFSTRNTLATITDTLTDGNYYWRTRAIDSRDRAGGWSRRRSVAKRWSGRPALLEPAEGASVAYPSTPLVLRWQPVPYAHKYLVSVATDPSLATSLVGNFGRPAETQGTALAVPNALAPGTRYYWAVTPLDAAGHRGTASGVGSFVWGWDSTTSPRLEDVNGTDEVFDPRFHWARVPGAAAYQVEVNTSSEFAAGSRVCCSDGVIGTSLTPTKLLPNNDGNDPGDRGYHWRVRALDANGNPGDWNRGDSFAKVYDTTTPSIRNLRVRDNAGDPLDDSARPTDLNPMTEYLDTPSPVLTWSPVPGASSYVVHVVPWTESGCVWSPRVNGETWGPLTTSSNSWSPVHSDNSRFVDGNGYCAKVTARSDEARGVDGGSQRVLGKEMVLGGPAEGASGAGEPAFRYEAPASVPSPPSLSMSASDYLQPVGSTLPRMPLFTWKAKEGACGYLVTIAKDRSFTNVVDSARTLQASYAPRDITYPDESTDYYWVVQPMRQDPSVGCAAFGTYGANSPQSFKRRSAPPVPLEPAEGAQVGTQPRFHWAFAEAARTYKLQVSRDPNFQDGRLLLDDVTTAATAYTSAATYPADAKVYWRVRANDENGRGLTWSDTRTFQRTLPVPTPGGDNPSGGEFLPVLSWPAVPGAVSYDLHVDWVDGRTSDFTLRSTAFTPSVFYGNGVWNWQVRANFPGATGRTVSGAYSPRRPFTRLIGAPTGARSTSTTKRLLVSWDPSRAAKEYRVQFSESNSFSRRIDSADVENTSYAPRLTQTGFLDGGPIYWRVAVVDDGNNLGAWSSGQVKLQRRMVVTVTGLLSRGRSGAVKVTVKDARGRTVRGARVTPRGAGVRSRPRHTGKRGVAKLRLRPRAKGTVRFRVDKRGFGPGSVTLRVG